MGARRLTGPNAAAQVLIDESVSTAMLLVMERLTPAERVALELYDVFQFPFGRVAEVLGSTPEQMFGPGAVIRLGLDWEIKLSRELVTIFLANNDDDTVEEDLGLNLASAVMGEDLAPPSCGVADFAGPDVIDALPDTDAGRAAAMLLSLIGDPVDETAGRAFVEDHLSEDLAPGATTEDLLGALGELQTELEGFSGDASAPGRGR
jgi:hypothetical protein